MSSLTSPAPQRNSAIEYFDARRAKVELPGSNRLISEFAHDLGHALSTADIFARGGLVFIVNERGDGLERMTPELLRSWSEDHVVCYREQKVGDGSAVVEFKRTMSAGDAQGVLASPQFYARLRKIQRVTPIRMPVMNLSGGIEFPAEGYDTGSETFTASSGVVIPDKIPLSFCKYILDDLLREFPFADTGRSKAVVIAAMLTVYGAGLLPRKSLRPCFIFLANAEGAGKSLLVKFCTVPVSGIVSNTSKPKDEDEMRKVLTTTVIEGRHVLCFDNFKGRLASESLEGFLTSQDWQGRVLGSSKTFVGENNTTVFITGNQCTVSPDMRRRSLFCELFMEAERAEDRKFSRQLEASTLIESQTRSDILSSLLGLIRHWDNVGRPKPSRSHSSFAEWSEIIGGIVEAAGYGCPLETPTIERGADVDGSDMRELVVAILGDSLLRAVTFEDLTAIAREAGVFERFIPADGDMDRADKARLAKVLGSYDGRSVGGCRFSIEGKGHHRKYRAERIAK